MKIRTVLFALVMLGVAAAGAAAQSRAAAVRTIAVALVDTLSRPENRAEILRFSDDSRPDVILLRRDATPEALTAAIVSYRTSVARTPTRAGAVGRTAITDFSTSTAAAADLRQRAAEMLAKVRRAPMTRVGNYGRGQWHILEVRIGG